MTYKEIVYMVLDECKLTSDDSYYTEDHVKFLANKYRTFLLKQRYADVKKQIPESNYQEICLNLEEIEVAPTIFNDMELLKSKEKFPNIMKIGNPVCYPINYYRGIEITYVSKDRMRYVGSNYFMNTIIYCSLGPDDYLYFTSTNENFKELTQVHFNAIFDDVEYAASLDCNNKDLDIMDMEFPLEGALVPQLIELCVKELLGAAYRPQDDVNNASDDLSDLASFIRKNAKTNLQKQIEG